MAYQITSDQLRKIAPSLPQTKADELAPIITSVGAKYGINTRLRMAAWIAEMVHESNSFKAKSESLNYAEIGLKETFSFYKNNPALARAHGRNASHSADQMAIANTVYDDKNRDASRKLGNTQPMDGWQFRGCSYIHITGRSIATRFAAYNKIDVRMAANLMRTTELWAVEGAAWYFAIEAKLLDEADKGDIDAISKRIAGSTIGLAERRELYKRALGVLK